MNHESQLLGYFAMLMMSAPSVNWQKISSPQIGISIWMFTKRNFNWARITGFAPSRVEPNIYLNRAAWVGQQRSHYFTNWLSPRDWRPYLRRGDGPNIFIGNLNILSQTQSCKGAIEMSIGKWLLEIHFASGHPIEIVARCSWVSP